MRKTLLIISILAMMATPVLAAQLLMDPEFTAQVDNKITIEVKGSSIIACGAQGLELEVISLTGRLMATYRIESPVQRVDLNLSRGCYVIKIGDIARKVLIR